MKITVLVEDSQAPPGMDLLNEHGLSFHISFQGNNILFDTGITDAFSKNSNVLGIDLASVHTAVISHHHYDHGGGIYQFLDVSKLLSTGSR